MRRVDLNALMRVCQLKHRDELHFADAAKQSIGLFFCRTTHVQRLYRIWHIQRVNMEMGIETTAQNLCVCVIRHQHICTYGHSFWARDDYK